VRRQAGEGGEATVTRTPIIPAPAVTWPEHRDALTRHTRLWEQDGLTFFSAA
jgi:hypothetical protein